MVSISNLISLLPMAKDLTTTYLGLKLRNPLVVAACPLTAELDTLRHMEQLGAAAAVMPSLFEEQIAPVLEPVGRPPRLGAESFDEQIQAYHQLDDYNRGPKPYLRQIELAKKAVSIPIIGSLNGITDHGWLHYARLMEEAGADALELNAYYVAADPQTTSGEIEARYVSIVEAVRAAVSIPVAVKLGPYFTSLANMAKRLTAAGANGLVLFNRFYQPDIDLETGKVSTYFRYSTLDEVHLPMRWIAILKGRVNASLAATGGIHEREQLVKVLLAGADVGQVASVLYQRGVTAIQSLLSGLERWLDQSDFNSLEQLKGTLSQKNCPDPDAFERAFYTKTIAETSMGSL
jgi:dihydroorotate dehydrogenase (fumarate)